MKTTSISFVYLGMFLSIIACDALRQTEYMDEQSWRLGWRMNENSWNENYNLAALQFDSLLARSKQLDERFLIYGLEAKVKSSNEKDAVEILSDQSPKIIDRICEEEYATGLKPCQNRPREKVENEELKLEIIELFVHDQAVRRNLMEDLILQYGIDTAKIPTVNMSGVDEINRNRLKEIFAEYGFPTRKLIGRKAMTGIFFIIQHADGDKEWQKSQLKNIELAVEKGDLTKPRYAYLFDRIQVNHKKPQRYGTQFAEVDRKRGFAELRETEDPANLDKRRREMNMMPIEVYKRLMLNR